MIDTFIIVTGILFGVFSFPTLFRKPTSKVWIPFYLINCAINYILDKILIEQKVIEYPVRFLPKVFNINFVYDFLVCPFLTIRFCQSVYHASLKGIMGKLLLFGIPQGLYEILLERKTNTIKFKKNWSWYHSLILVFVLKLIMVGGLIFFKKFILERREKKQ